MSADLFRRWEGGLKNFILWTYMRIYPEAKFKETNNADCRSAALRLPDAL